MKEHAILTPLIPGTPPTWFVQVETIATSGRFRHTTSPGISRLPTRTPLNPSTNAPRKSITITPRPSRPSTRNTTRAPMQVSRDRSKPPFYGTGPVPPTPARMKLLALVLALSANSRPDAPNCEITSLGFRRLPTWRIVTIRHAQGGL